MATDRSFNDMLNQYLDIKMLKEEQIKRNYVLRKIPKDNNWKGGSLIVPFKGAQASTLTWGSLAATTDVSDYEYVRGSVDSQRECWGTLKFRARDIAEHNGVKSGRVSEQSFLKIFPDQIDEFMDYMKESVNIVCLAGNNFATLTANSTANDGNITVDRPEYFQLGQKVIVDDDDTAAATGYVKSININTGVINLVTTRGGSTVVDFSGAPMTTAQNAKCFFDGAETATNVFTSMKSQLLSYTNGGSETLFGQTKTAYPYLQAYNYSGSAITAMNILDKIFDAFVAAKKIGKGMPNTALMSYTNWGYCMKLLEIGSGPYKYVGDEASLYGWDEVTIKGPKGTLKIVAVNEMPDTEIFGIDWRGWKFYSNGWFRVQKDPEGKMYYTVRTSGANGGYYYYVDICLFGEQVCKAPSYNFIIHSISI